MVGTNGLVAGLRLSKALRLRVKDIDLEYESSSEKERARRTAGHFSPIRLKGRSNANSEKLGHLAGRSGGWIWGDLDATNARS